MFLPWHREMLRRFEAALKEIDPSVSLPYYDWGFDGQTPLRNTAVFGSGSDAFGTTGGCVTNGFPAGWTDATDNACLRRNYASSFTFPDNAQLAPFVISSGNFESFANQVETAHNNVHVTIGGSGGDMSNVNRSPNDPLFYLHHANIDRLWYRWQKNHPAIAKQYFSTASVNDIMNGFGIPVSDALISDGGGSYCIQYQPYSASGDVLAATNRAAAASSNDTQITQAQIEKLRDIAVANPFGTGDKLPARKPVQPIPDDWINNLAMGSEAIAKMKTMIRKAEADLAAVTDKLDRGVEKFLSENPDKVYSDAVAFVLSRWEF
ncbi:hypothetical protein BJ741DRAFT_545588 [Chytriomyces cf. hyalinus JEL632]|nr:hypothetical protein BJ741DRAFT_545588 [Chytriomyces cf. hyalinus JEL632]